MEYFDKFGEGRCINCGFLGKKDRRPEASICYEASAVDRISGKFIETSAGLTTVPWCFLSKVYFHIELNEISAQASDFDKVEELIKKERNCPYWYKYTEFVSPKEHYDEFKMMKLEQRQNRN